MSSPRHLDALIFGGGLAGSLLAWCLQDAGKAVLLVDAPPSGPHPPAWAVAAGLAAPVSGQRATLLPDAAATLLEAHRLYPALEKSLGARFWRPLPLWRCFSDEADALRWRQRCGEEAFQPYLREMDPKGLPMAEQLQPLAAVFEISQGGHLNINALVPALHRYMESRQAFKRARVNPGEVISLGHRARWQGYEARYAVFCEGIGHAHNPLFPALRFQATRGEMLELEIDGLHLDQVLYGKHFLIPMPEGRFLCGATYDREDLVSGPTESGQAELEAGIQALLRLPYKIVGRRCGIRPNVLGHEALWQAHPELNGFWRLNGLGSKGAWSAPRLCAQALIDLA